jgi:miniconductance mechanosensitive channel
MEWDRWVALWEEYSPVAPWAQIMVGLGALVVLAIVAEWVVWRTVRSGAHHLLIISGRKDWDIALRKRRTYRYIAYAVPFVVVAVGIAWVPHIDRIAEVIGRLAHAVAWVFSFMAFGGFLNALKDVYSATPRAQVRSITGYIQIAKLALAVICTVLVLSITLDRSPLWMLSGLGALSAILILVFKDTLLSFVASTQLTSNDMLRIGDWIEMPQANADGFVRDIALHTVKVQNWDNTVTTVPTYKLFSESYRNYRQMFESGGRRIKRTLRVDVATVRFLTDEEAQQLMRFRLLRDYLNTKALDLHQANSQLDSETAVLPANRRRLTNIGTFRAYGMAYLRQHPEIRKDMLMMVRMLEPQSDGIPVEVYCFSSLTAIVDFERIQGDIFDHMLSILPELGLRLYQHPSGADVGAFGSGLAASIQQELARERALQSEMTRTEAGWSTNDGASMR